MGMNYVSHGWEDKAAFGPHGTMAAAAPAELGPSKIPVLKLTYLRYETEKAFEWAS